jgi:acetylornithine deacetylase/succinyl-diaminopimelate desuccinylase-like protein
MKSRGRTSSHGSISDATSDPIAPAAILRRAQLNFPEFFDLLALPNDPAVPEDIRKNADRVERAFGTRSFRARQLPNDGRPLVFAQYPSPGAAAKTVLFYMHFDGMPVIDSQWSQKSPFVAALKQKRAGLESASQWEEIDRDKLQGKCVDPEWRLFARSSSDDKGPIMMFLSAVDLLKEAGLDPAIKIKVLLDSEEEKGSPGIGAVAEANRKLLEADAVVILDGTMHESNLPTIVFGNRGAAVVRLTVYGPKIELHSGYYGNIAPNPAQRLASLLASMKGEQGRVTVAGYYDTIKLTDAERAIMASVPDDPAALLERLGIAKRECVGANLQEAVSYPSLNVRGMQAAAVGDKGTNIIPSQAVAELDLRTVPGADPAYLVGLIEAHIRAQGFHLCDGEPSDLERAEHPKLASFNLLRSSASAITPMDSPLGTWAQTALTNAFSKNGQLSPVVRIRMMGASVPTAKLVHALHLPFVIVPLVNPDDNEHSFDENLRIGHYLDGIRAVIHLLRLPLELSPARLPSSSTESRGSRMRTKSPRTS